MKRYSLNVGCGKLHKSSTDEEEWINLDQFEEVSPDIVYDITAKELPFDDDTFDGIQAIACLGQIESNKDFRFVMNELHRVLKPDCKIFILLPHQDYSHCYMDPFNQRRTNEEHWLGFDETSDQYKDHNHYYKFKAWKDVEVTVNKGFLNIWMTKP